MAVQFVKNENTFQVHNGDRHATVHFPTDRLAYLKAPAEAMRATIDNVVTDATRTAKRFSDDAFATEVLPVLNPLFVVARDLQKEAVSRKAHLETLKADLLDFPVDPVKADSIRQSLRGVEPVKIFSLAFKDPEINAAVLAMPTLFGLTPDLIAKLESALIQANWERKFANQEQPKHATLDDLIPVGPDLALVKQRAGDAMLNFENSQAELVLTEQLLSGVINFAAVTASLSPVEIFNKIGF